MKIQHFRAVPLLASLVLGSSLNVAQAEPGTTVEFRDLDLRKPRDVATLYARMERRAVSVCKHAASPWMAGHVQFVKKCVAAAVDDAVARANVGALTALHESKIEAARVAQARGE
jgi:UrcA family protein